MRIRETHAAEEDPINLMPLIDMVFLLLIFFLVATTFAQEEREMTIELPGTAQAKRLSAPPRQLIINVQRDGSVIVAAEKYDMKGLADLLVRVVRKEPDREVLIRADKQSLHLYFAGVADLCRQVGIGEMKIGYTAQEAKPVPVK